MGSIYTWRRNNSSIDALEYAKQMEENGAGELLVTSMDRDGTHVGYDIDLMSNISSKVNIPVIASGGVGNLDHLVDGIQLGKASAVLAASIFHFGKYSLKEAKEYLDSKGIPVKFNMLHSRKFIQSSKKRKNSVDGSYTNKLLSNKSLSKRRS